MNWKKIFCFKSNSHSISIPVEKIGNIPLRDTSICCGPDNYYYLTGTIPPFFGDNRGIKIWKSQDLKNWTDLGIVWQYGESPWHAPYRAQKKSLWAPEIHYLKETFWLTYSMPGWDGTGKTSGSGLLKSLSGKAEGPYIDMHPNERLGDEIDASLFQDDDGEVYFVWHCGKIARMNKEMTRFAENYTLLETISIDSDPNHHSGLCATIFGSNSYQHVGFEGGFLFKRKGIYYLACADSCNGRYSCYIATSSSVLGPYSDRYEAIPHGGHNMFFQDFQGMWYSTYFGSDKYAPWQEKPGIIPIEFGNDDRIYLLKDGKKDAPHSNGIKQD